MQPVFTASQWTRLRSVKPGKIFIITDHYSPGIFICGCKHNYESLLLSCACDGALHMTSTQIARTDINYIYKYKQARVFASTRYRSRSFRSVRGRPGCDSNSISVRIHYAQFILNINLNGHLKIHVILV